MGAEAEGDLQLSKQKKSEKGLGNEMKKLLLPKMKALFFMGGKKTKKMEEDGFRCGRKELLPKVKKSMEEGKKTLGFDTSLLFETKGWGILGGGKE